LLKSSELSLEGYDEAVKFLPYLDCPETIWKLKKQEMSTRRGNVDAGVEGPAQAVHTCGITSI
jgi:hypothetical protein